MKMPEFVWSAPISTSLREKLLSGPYTSPKMAHLYAVALDVNGEVWAQWQAGCAWVVDSEAAKVTANAVFVELAAAQAERDRLQAMVPRLEWSERDTGGYKLSLHVGKLEFGILSAEKQEEGWWVVIRLTHWTWLSVDEAAALVADHIASLDLPCTSPAFPGLVQQ